jgi:hypothetical protein
LNKDTGDRSTPILLSKDDSTPPEPDAFKVQKMTPADRAKMGWESPPGWNFNDETITARITKLKKRDGEVENPVLSPAHTTASPPPSRVVLPEASTPASGSRCSSRILGSDAEPVLQKAIRATSLRTRNVRFQVMLLSPLPHCQTRIS